MDRLRHMTLRMIVVAAYATVMMVMGFLHQPVFADGGEDYAFANELEEYRLPDGTLPIICVTITEDREDQRPGESEEHRHRQIICEACLVNSGQIAAPAPPVLPLPAAERAERITIVRSQVPASRHAGGAGARAPPFTS
ncbi:hypothetical protein GR183_16880 [Stappia sp. GBMRC 2046]|uniref:DUF2946 domain-containing protein n=1 Tax=Stappia sediminis TaxID=2692190 RepID=A0A7X3LWZ3_9HYPH|nr:hypothetical protein [Stappia sediminis]MXN66593.1 hypothetical protein [Stappia sediminis]